MTKSKSNQIKSYQEKTILDNFLWFAENYLPQKKKRTSNKEFILEKLESGALNKINKLASARSESIRGDLNHTKITFTVGKWALPYLNLMKVIKILK